MFKHNKNKKHQNNVNNVVLVFLLTLKHIFSVPIVNFEQVNIRLKFIYWRNPPYLSFVLFFVHLQAFLLTMTYFKGVFMLIWGLSNKIFSAKKELLVFFTSLLF